MKKNYLRIFLSLTLTLTSLLLFAQPVEKLVKIIVAPDHADWVYKPGEIANFDVSVMKNSELLTNVKIKYEFGKEMMVPTKRDSAILKDGRFKIEGGTMKEAGFLRCRVSAVVDGVRYENLATAAYSPDQIKPTTEMPSDFVQFWDKAKAEASRIPMDAKVTLLPDRCTEKVNVYLANIQNYGIGTRLYGILCVPKKAGKYPAVLKLPGAGVRPYSGEIAMAEKGVITFEIGIHGIPVTMDPSVYIDLGRSVLDGYWLYNLDNRDRYYYKRVYLGCLRAIDFIYSLPEFDGSSLGVNGGSQGGALTIVTAGLDPRVKYIAAMYPALCDLAGYLNGRAGGWPHMFNEANAAFNAKKDKIETSKYYDVVNFARMVKVPGYYSWGFNDTTCPPTSTYSAYNVIQAPKSLYIYQEIGHWVYPEQYEKLRNWLVNKLMGEVK
ncbi:MAG: acetylxylan esterase [Prolixibacteraceae bacterium]|jgi:cephalosporin-C deacetylase-like acetyl esterase|nr:acetylxylan esterase [Prolixibacteraceae bacterium]